MWTLYRGCCCFLSRVPNSKVAVIVWKCEQNKGRGEKKILSLLAKSSGHNSDNPVKWSLCDASYYERNEKSERKMRLFLSFDLSSSSSYNGEV